jgi:uncharacterized RDD family membrane protein YckC
MYRLSASSTKPQSRGEWLAPVPASDRRFVSIWRRFVSMGYEAFLLVGPVLVVAFLYTVLTGSPPPEASASPVAPADGATQTAGDFLRRVGLQVCVYGAIAGYFVWGWSRGRVTLPMQTLRIQLVDIQSGGPLSRRQAFKRFVWATLSVLTGLWLLVPLFRRDRQTLHDLMAGTQLIHRAALPT